MDAVKFFKELERLSENDLDSFNKLGFIIDYKEKVDFVEKWSKEYPLKTRMEDFLEKHPNAPFLLIKKVKKDQEHVVN